MGNLLRGSPLLSLPVFCVCCFPRGLHWGGFPCFWVPKRQHSGETLARLRGNFGKTQGKPWQDSGVTFEKEAKCKGNFCDAQGELLILSRAQGKLGQCAGETIGTDPCAGETFKPPPPQEYTGGGLGQCSGETLTMRRGNFFYTRTVRRGNF